MFRVLSEEEAGKVTRWKAPELDGTTANLAKTTEWTSPIIPAVDKPKKPEDPGYLKPNSPSGLPKSAPELQGISRNVGSAVNGLAVANPSVDILQTSYDEGHAKGYSEGLAAIHEQAVRELQTVIGAIRESSIDTHDDSVHEEVVGLSIDIARLLLKREIQVDPEAMLQLVKVGLEQLPSVNTGSRQVHLHPKDADMVRGAVGDTRDIELVDDTAMRRGNCRITTHASTLNCGIDEWLKGMATQLGIVDDDNAPDDSNPTADSGQ